jgi:hypothetical protein
MDHDEPASRLELPADPANSAPTVPPPAKNPRSPVERAVVWGVILIGLVVLMVELRATYSLAADRDALLAAIDRSPTSVTESEAEKLITRYSQRESQSGLHANVLAASRVDTYKYGGLLKKRVLYVYYGLKRRGHEQDVLEVTETPIRFYTPEEFGLGPDGKPVPKTKQDHTRPNEKTDSERSAVTDEKSERSNPVTQTAEEEK